MQHVTRLIHEFEPINYNLSLVIDRPGRAFTGTVTIKGTSSENKITLHAKELTINEVLIDGKSAQATSNNDDTITITQHNLPAGQHIVTIGYSGAITDTLHGLYPCYYAVDGVDKELLMTQFESHHAREVFPCVDEPEAKATFDISVTTETGITVLGNMPIAQQDKQEGRLVTTFAQTPRMSTYLVALVMGELQHKTASTKEGTEVSIWATAAQSPDSLDFALHHAVQSIEFFNDYFDVRYPLPKSDHVAVPDFSSGAMENWGLITYRESALLADPATTTISDKQYIATVISHELSHQWFGNLVTMKWWNNLWLNESFANLMEYLAVDALHPDWHMWDQFCNNEGSFAFNRDSIAGVQSVQTEVNHPDEISTLFDGAIVYAKGGRLLYMLLNWIGESAFRAGLHEYFLAHAYHNTESNDLWGALSSASGKDVAALMNHWITTPGYPVVTFEQTGSTVTLTQQQFFVGPHNPSDTIWRIPLHPSSTSLPDILDTKKAIIGDIDPKTTLLLNKGNVSHFITQYDAESLSRLVDLVRAGSLSVVDRSLLLSQQLLLAKAEKVSSASLIDLLDAYSEEENEEVWGIMSQVIGHLKIFIDPGTPEEKALRHFVGSLAAKNFARLGWSAQPQESENDTKLRATILAHMLYSENHEVIHTAKQLYQDNSLNDLDSELRDIIMTAAVRYSDTPLETITSLIDTYRMSASTDLRHDISSAVTSTRNVESIERLIGLLTDTKTIRTQDTAFWFVYLLRNRDARTKTWQWLQENWAWIDTQFGSDKSLDYFPRYAGNILATQAQLDEYIAFFSPLRADATLTRVIDMGITDITARVHLIEHNAPLISAKLLELYSTTDTSTTE